jgi:hypothetical protein
MKSAAQKSTITLKNFQARRIAGRSISAWFAIPTAGKNFLPSQPSRSSRDRQFVKSKSEQLMK